MSEQFFDEFNPLRHEVAKHRAFLDEVERLIAAYDRASSLIAAAYLLAGIVDAPVEWLDALSRQDRDGSALLPVGLEDLDEFVRIQRERDQAREDGRRLEWLLRRLPVDVLRSLVGEVDPGDIAEILSRIDAMVEQEQVRALREPAEGQEVTIA